MNQKPIKKLEDLVEAVRDSKEKYITIEFNERDAEAIVLDRRQALDATEEILSDNGIRSECSDDLKPLWKKRRTTE